MFNWQPMHARNGLAFSTEAAVGITTLRMRTAHTRAKSRPHKVNQVPFLAAFPCRTCVHILCESHRKACSKRWLPCWALSAPTFTYHHLKHLRPDMVRVDMPSSINKSMLATRCSSYEKPPVLPARTQASFCTKARPNQNELATLHNAVCHAHNDLVRHKASY